MKSKIAWFGIGAAIIIVVSIVVLVVVTISKPSSTATPTQASRSVSGQTAEKDKANALQAAIDLLNSTNAPSNKDDFSALMTKLDAGTATIPDDFTKRVRYVDSLASDKKINNTLYQTIVTLAFLAKKSSTTGTIAPLYSENSTSIILDQENGIAYVPTTLFVSSSSGVNGFSLEFIYMNGEWVLSPYMTLDELRLALVLQGSTSSSSGSSTQ